MGTMRWLIMLTVTLAAARVARGDDEIARGTVVRIEAQEIYVSLGRERGVTAGAPLRLARPITLHHPVTHAAIEDAIPIGEARVTQAGTMMSRAVVGELVTDIKVGDLAEVLIDRREPEAPPPPASDVDPETAEVLRVFAAQSGQPLGARITMWEQYLSAHPASPYADGVRRDLEALQVLREQLRPPREVALDDVTATVSHHAPAEARPGAALPLAFVLDQPERVASAYLHYRTQGSPTYHALLLARDHDIYLRGAIPAAAVRAPGLEYFVEVTAPDGRAGLALASPAQPIAVAVAGPPIAAAFEPVPGRSSVRLTVDYMDFATFDRRSGDHTDHVTNATADFTYRMPGTVESLGVGYGVYAGAGGLADAVWTAKDPLPHDAFHYGYADIEIGGRTGGVHVSLGGQLIAGVGRGGFGMGGEGRLRIGERDATNLAFVARTIDQVGWLSDIRFGTRPVRDLLLTFSVGATNQPNDGDTAVRLATAVEILRFRNLDLLVDGSWQGRSVAHAGVGGGTALGFTW